MVNNSLGKLHFYRHVCQTSKTELQTKLIFNLCLKHRDPRINLKENQELKI